MLTDLEIPPGLTDTAITELGKSGRYTIEHILVTDTIKHFWRLDATPKPTSPEPPKPSRLGITADTRQAQIYEEGEAEETAELTEGARYGKQD